MTHRRSRQAVGGHLVAVAHEARELDPQMRPLGQRPHDQDGLGRLAGFDTPVWRKLNGMP